ncbi:MAG: 16S rRNA (uracil(1498)-N(3))-methyltransferase [Deltaproteobacteria bacterium]|nr:16S rRNA (uracil(1498)-N(3))-methyltransferase [Deltaproteobacteria bacterium]
MTIPRIRYDSAIDDSAIISGHDLHYLKDILRLREGEDVFLIAPNGEFRGHIRAIGEHEIAINIVDKIIRKQSECRITLAQSLLKADKMEFVVQKLCELGISSLIPFISQRTISRPDKEKSLVKREKWEKISSEAARKSLRSEATVVKPVIGFEEMLLAPPATCVKAICWEEEESLTLKEFFATIAFPSASTIFFVIGPEGGFTKEEISIARGKGFSSVSLGKALLKAETAAIATAAIIAYLTGHLGDK